MRILHVTDRYQPSVGGIELMVDRLSAHQRAAGHETRVVTWTPGPALDGVDRDPRHLDRLLAWCDVVHVHVSIVSPLAFVAFDRAVAAHRPIVASVHSMWTHCEGPVSLVAAAGRWRRMPILWAPVSEVAAQSVRETLGPDVAMAVLPNAVDPDEWRIARTPCERPVEIAWVGRLARRKRPLGAVDVLERMRDLVDPSIPVHATIAGDGSRRGRLARKLDRLGMTGWVDTPGDVGHAEIRELYSRSDVFLSTCTLESFGIAALEARTAGLVIVGRTGTGIADFITPGVDGLLADSDEELAQMLAELVTDPVELPRMLAHNAVASPGHGWDDLMARTEQMYRQAASLQGILPATEVGRAV